MAATLGPGDVEALIRSTAGRYDFPDADLLVATARQESGLNPRAVGDSGNSRGIFQENIHGRGHGLAPEQSFDPAAATERAIREFQAIRARNPNVDRGTWAALAQRPADSAGYARSVNALLGGAAPRAAAPVGPVTAQPDPHAPAWYQDLTGVRDASFRYGRDEGPGVTPSPNPPARAPEGAEPEWYRELLGSPGAQGAAPAGAAGGLAFTVEGQSRARNQLTNPFGAPQVRSGGFSGALPAQNYGVDVAAPVGTPVHAPAGARVKQVLSAAGANYGYGNSVTLDLGGNVELASHLRETPNYRPGDVVRAGDVVGRVGLTGNTTGPHLDNALRVDGQPVDFFKLYDDPAIQRRLGQPGAATGAAAPATSGGEAPAWYRDLMG